MRMLLAETDDLTLADFERAFDQQLRAILDDEKALSWNSSRFRQMLDEDRGVRVAKRLFTTNPPPGTFAGPRNANRLDLTAEYWVVQYGSIAKKRGLPLFTDDEIEAAQWRLEFGE